MSLILKTCIFCDRKLPVGMFRNNPASRDGRWSWCKQCEKKSVFDENKGDIKHVVSFSGGKDSTAMLLRMLEENMPVDVVVYFDCGSFEWPQMEEHIKLVERDTGKKILRVRAHKDFYELATELQPRNREINGWPTPSLRWCTMIKINLIKQALRPYRPYWQYIGFSSDENDRVLKAASQKSTASKKKFFRNRFPLVDWGMTERDCLDYCHKRGYRWSGLYDHFSRVSCWCCPLQNHKDLAKMHKHYPEMFQRLVDWNEKMPNQFKNDERIFEKIQKLSRGL